VSSVKSDFRLQVSGPSLASMFILLIIAAIGLIGDITPAAWLD
jgi:hypothetical protein